jgi:hypothetical protein
MLAEIYGWFTRDSTLEASKKRRHCWTRWQTKLRARGNVPRTKCGRDNYKVQSWAASGGGPATRDESQEAAHGDSSAAENPLVEPMMEDRLLKRS